MIPNRIAKGVFAGIAALAATSASAQPVLQLPIDCVPGESCFVQNFVDHDGTEMARDFTCGFLTYDGHKGTDFALPTHQAMQDGVAVLAAAPGVVLGLRNNMPDTGLNDTTRADLKGRECGNGVVIGHGDGWQTQYCHMKQGSVAVRKGQKVAAGDMLGEVGLSGWTEFVHLHLSLRHKGKTVDPYAPDLAEGCAVDEARTLWADPPAYNAGALLRAGFADASPDYDEVSKGRAAMTMLAPDAPALVAFGYGYGGRKGDVIRITITGPGGQITDHSATLKRNHARFMQVAGRKRTGLRWPAGLYRATITLTREGQTLSDLTTTIRID